MMLSLFCLMTLGNSFCLDLSSGLEHAFITDMQMPVTDYTLMISICYWPNIIMCMICGFLIDHVFGVGLSAITCAFLVLTGQFVFACGIFVNCFWLCCVGRFLFGIGSECTFVAQHAYVAEWFKNSQLSLAFGVTLSFNYLADAVGLAVSQPLYDELANLSLIHI